MNLSGDEIKQLVNAIISAYPTKDDLDMMKIEKPPPQEKRQYMDDWSKWIEKGNFRAFSDT